MKIIIVDDNSVDRITAKKALKTLDAEIDEVSTGEEFLKMCEESEYDCIVMDHMLTDWKSPDLIKHMREKDISYPVIVLTGQGDERLAVSLMRENMCSDYIIKTDVGELLVDAVQKTVSAHQLQKKTLAKMNELNKALSNKLEEMD